MYWLTVSTAAPLMKVGFGAGGFLRKSIRSMNRIKSFISIFFSCCEVSMSMFPWRLKSWQYKHIPTDWLGQNNSPHNQKHKWNKTESLIIYQIVYERDVSAWWWKGRWLIDAGTNFHGHDSIALLSGAKTQRGYQDGGVISQMEKFPLGLKPLRETAAVIQWILWAPGST